MANEYNKELNQALKQVNATLYNETLLELNIEKAAKLGLYYAHGHTEKAVYTLNADQVKSITSGKQYQAASEAAGEVGSIVTSATASARDAQQTDVLVATAAVNLQAASNALADLAADAATVLSIAMSKDYDSKIEDLSKQAYKETQRAADSAEVATVTILNTTIGAAETKSLAANTLSETETLNGDTKLLLKALDNEVAQFQSLIKNDLAKVQDALNNENQQSGIYKTALAEEDALQSAGNFIDQYVNQYLKVIPVGTAGDQFTLSFNGLEDDPLIAKEYRVIITPLDDAADFDDQKAKSTPVQNYVVVIPSRINGSKRPSHHWGYSVDYVTAEYLIGNDNKLPRKHHPAIDYKGNPVVRGIPYVFFVYTIHTNEFINKTENTAGYLTLPAKPMTLQANLPSVAEEDGPYLSFYKALDDVPAARVIFRMKKSSLVGYGEPDLSKIMQFNVFLFNEKDYQSNQLNKFIDEGLLTLFNLERELKKKEEAYLQAEKIYQRAVALGDANPAQLESLKFILDITKRRYEVGMRKYNLQQKKVEQLNRVKISDFFIDNDILNQIPAANSMVALPNPDIFEQIQSHLNDLKIEQTAQERKISYRFKLVEENQIKIQKLQAVEKVEGKELETLKEELIKFMQELKKNEKGFVKYLTKDEIFQKKLKELGVITIKLEQFIKIDLSLLVSVGELKGFEKELNNIIEMRKKIQEKETTIVALELDINNLEKENIINQTEIDSFNSVIKRLTHKIDELTNELAELVNQKSRMSTANSKGESVGNKRKIKNRATEEKPSDDYIYYAATGVGDIVDNYGQPLIHNEKYAALLYSTIDEINAPLAVPLYAPVQSDFSKPRSYDFS